MPSQGDDKHGDGERKRGERCKHRQESRVSQIDAVKCRVLPNYAHSGRIKYEENLNDELHDTWGLTPKVSGTGAPKVRRAPTQAMKMAKPWPVLVSA